MNLVISLSCSLSLASTTERRASWTGYRQSSGRRCTQWWLRDGSPWRNDVVITKCRRWMSLPGDTCGKGVADDCRRAKRAEGR
jgi:hypothetical protein